jgi:hypothetical protein
VMLKAEGKQSSVEAAFAGTCRLLVMASVIVRRFTNLLPLPSKQRQKQFHSLQHDIFV